MKRAMWPVMFAVLVLALAIGSWPQKEMASGPEARAQSIAQQVRCPTCAGLSVGESDSPLARSAREEIAQRVDAGQSDQQIKDFFVSVYGAEALTAPPSRGFGGLVWLIPILVVGVVVVLAVASLKRWRSVESTRAATEEDQRLVEEALQERK